MFLAAVPLVLEIVPSRPPGFPFISANAFHDEAFMIKLKSTEKNSEWNQKKPSQLYIMRL